MTDDRWLRRFGQWYAKLLQLYPVRHHARFGTGMAQAFNDLLREHAGAGRSPGRLALVLFAEALVSIMRVQTSTAMQNNALTRPAIGTALVLLIPLVMTIVDRGRPPGDGWDWAPGDFAAMGTLLFVAGVSFELLSKRVGSTLRRVALGGGISIVVLAVWAELAVRAVSQLLGAIAG
jgi:hypothetical protein